MTTLTADEIARRAKLGRILRLAELRDQTAIVDALTPAQREARICANLDAHAAAQAALEAAL